MAENAHTVLYCTGLYTVQYIIYFTNSFSVFDRRTVVSGRTLAAAVSSNA